MSIRLKCSACQAAFLTADDHLGRSVPCPKCGAEQQVPASVPAGDPDSPEPSVWVPRAAEPVRPRRSWLRVVAPMALILLVVASVAVLVAWPALRARWAARPSAPRPAPLDPVEVAARDYLDALVAGNVEAARRLGTVEDPPGIDEFRAVRRDPAGTQALKGSFAPIAALHRRIAETYEYDAKIGRFTPRNPLGPAAETLDALHEVKKEAEAKDLYAKMQSGDPEEIFDAAEGLASAYRPLAKLAETALAPRKLIPTYAQLVEQASPPLPPAEKSLALDYGAGPETWAALLNRPFVTLRADGPFLLDRAEVTAAVRDRLASSGEPLTPLRLTLTRFRLEGIDTGWRVTSARREPPDSRARTETAATPDVPR